MDAPIRQPPARSLLDDADRVDLPARQRLRADQPIRRGIDADDLLTDMDVGAVRFPLIVNPLSASGRRALRDASSLSPIKTFAANRLRLSARVGLSSGCSAHELIAVRSGTRSAQRPARPIPAADRGFFACVCFWG